MDAILKDRLSMIAALGAGVVVGVSGIYLYYKLNRSVTRELTHLAGTIESLRREIEELKSVSTTTQRQPAASSSTRNVSPEKRPFVASSGSSQFVASSSVEDPDEEYFDFTDTEEVSSSWATVNGLLTGNDVAANSKTEFFSEVDKLLDDGSSDKESLYCMMSAKKDEYSENIDYLWRLAKATHLYGIVAQKRAEMDKKKELSFEAFQYASEALALDQENPEVHKWYAITIGSLAEYVGTQEKIENGKAFKEHVDRAIELKPRDPTLHHMLGRWCYEVAMLSWLERKIASTLFSSPPESTLEESRTHLIMADKLKGCWKENMLFIAKAYIGEGDYENAISWIDKAVELPCEREDDEIAQSELETLQYRYQKYRV